MIKLTIDRKTYELVEKKDLMKLRDLLKDNEEESNGDLFNKFLKEMD